MSVKSCLSKFSVSTLVLGVTATILTGCTALGEQPSGERLARIEASPQWAGDRFVDKRVRKEASLRKMFRDWWSNDNPDTVPASVPPVMKRTAADFANLPSNGLRVTWLGHSTMLVEIDGRRILLDPIWSERPSPVSWAGPKRFHQPPLALEDLPELDAVVISHDHYDHLDLETVQALAATGNLFVVPLGVGAHLESWGVAPDRIVELDWWQSHRIGDLKLVATPARHFSGRSMIRTDLDKTLWAGWALVGPEHRVYFSGDTAMFDGFTEIGKRLGPFDVTMIETGAYNKNWTDVHLGPEQAVQAHHMVQGKLMIPVHWGTFELAMHGWTAPIERTLAAAEKCDAQVASPRIGESVRPGTGQKFDRWWPDVPFRSGKEDRIISSGYEGQAISCVAG